MSDQDSRRNNSFNSDLKKGLDESLHLELPENGKDENSCHVIWVHRNHVSKHVEVRAMEGVISCRKIAT